MDIYVCVCVFYRHIYTLATFLLPFIYWCTPGLLALDCLCTQTSTPAFPQASSQLTCSVYVGLVRSHECIASTSSLSLLLHIYTNLHTIYWFCFFLEPWPIQYALFIKQLTIYQKYKHKCAYTHKRFVSFPPSPSSNIRDISGMDAHVL